MGSLQTMAMMMAFSGVGQVAGVGETLLLDFTAHWCGPCQQVAPTVDRLIAAGYPVRKVDIDRHRSLAAQYRVTSIPCFVMVVNGREVDREVGPASQQRLVQMLSKGRVQPPAQQNARTSAQSPDGSAAATFAGGPQAPPPSKDSTDWSAGTQQVAARTNPPQRAAPRQLDSRLLKATVRIKVEDASGHSYGTGTIINARGDEALVLTCGHIFRDSDGKGPITIDLVGMDPPRQVTGRLIGFDLKRDLGLLSIKPGVPVEAARVAAKGHTSEAGDRVVNVGCNNGNHPTVRHSRVTAIDKYLGPPNIEVAGMPIEGRSGGGLFDSEGNVIGVCFAADPADNEGVYAAIDSIHAELDRLGLQSVYAPQERAPQAKAALVAVEPPPMPTQMPVRPVSTDNPVASTRSNPFNQVRDVRTASTSPDELQRLSPTERAALSELQERTKEAEVICIIRPLAGSSAKSEIIVLDRASPLFLKQLSGRPHGQDGRRLTTLEVPRQRSPQPYLGRSTRRATSDHR